MPKKNDERLLTALIQKQMVILGPNVALGIARQVHGVHVDDKGVVTAITGDNQKVLEGVVDAYVSLSGEITRTIFKSLIEEFK